jgi:flagellar protein FlaG
MKMRIQNIDNAAYMPIAALNTNVKVDIPTPPMPANQTKDPTSDQLQASIDKISGDLKKNKVNLDFSIDKSTKEIVVKVIDSSTGDVLTQLPSKQALAISELLANKKVGSLLNDQA